MNDGTEVQSIAMRKSRVSVKQYINSFFSWGSDFEQTIDDTKYPPTPSTNIYANPTTLAFEEHHASDVNTDVSKRDENNLYSNVNIFREKNSNLNI